jgi:uncharacterized 2Fe-2S/4Fe-4S cluster protein (DUF4445 family)
VTLPRIVIKADEGEQIIEFLPGQSVREILDTTGSRVRSRCSGNGACGLCRVRVKGAGLPQPNPAELIYLSDEQISSGVRLACQIRPDRDVEVSVLDPEPVSTWRSMPGPGRSFPGLQSGLPGDVKTPYGVAIDLGTTHISLSFYDLSNGQWFTGRHGLNPQGSYGTDVVTRLCAAHESQHTAHILKRLVVDAIGMALMDVAAREGICLDRVVKATVVGNTAMLALLSGRNFHLLLQPSYWMRPIDCALDNPGELAADWGINPEATVEILPPLSGFVGSDLLAGILATRLFESEPGTLLIDFGTNSEIALWDGECLWVTSAAGGPAFEGCGISCGIPAEPGAIHQVRELESHGKWNAETRGKSGDSILESDVLGLGLEFRTIDHEKPRGLCGSGIVDLIACLLRSGKLTSIGRFSDEVSGGSITLLNGDRGPLLLTKRDVDVFQRAKAAISAAVRVLLSTARMRAVELKRIHIGGAFGHFLDRENSIEIGLLPELSHDAIELCGNSALRGCEELLMSGRSTRILTGLKAGARLINLAQVEEFDAMFLEGLYLGKWKEVNESLC